MADLAGLPRGEAADALRRHLGVCYDVCHAAVEFEDPRASVELLRDKGIAIPKLHLSAALKVEHMNGETARHFAPFDEPIYLHQVVARNGNKIIRHPDLPEALAGIAAEAGSEWRVHFHVPIFLERMEYFSTTQDWCGVYSPTRLGVRPTTRITRVLFIARQLCRAARAQASRHNPDRSAVAGSLPVRAGLPTRLDQRTFRDEPIRPAAIWVRVVQRSRERGADATPL